jgi:DNA invertase Pin-like site-specific DNA recombinase
MMTSLLTEVKKEKIKFLYESGNTTEQIAKIYNVTAPTIRRFMRKVGMVADLLCFKLKHYIIIDIEPYKEKINEQTRIRNIRS